MAKVGSSKKEKPRNLQRQPGDVLLVEDNTEDVELTRAAFDATGITKQLHVARDGKQALDFLFRRGAFTKAPRPDLVLLDLNLPYIKGQEVLRQIKAAPDLRQIPVVMLTMSQSPEHVLQAYQAGAAAYVPKPVDFQEFIEAVRTLDRFWFHVATLPGRSSVPTRVADDRY